MKVISRLLLLITVIMLPLVVNAKDSVTITKIVEVEKKGQTVVKAEPTFEGLTINYNLSFSEVHDSITYKATIKNNDNEDYKITNRSDFSTSGYIKYSFEFSDASSIIKPNETKDMFVTIEYNKEVPDEELIDGVYTENNKMNIILVNEEGQIPNPNTNSSIIILLITLGLVLLSIYLFKYHKKASILLLIVALSIPVTTYALKEIRVTLNTKIIINNEREFCNYDQRDNGTTKNYYKYRKGMTVAQWKNSSYYNDIASIGSFVPKDVVDCLDEVRSHYDLDNMSEEDWNNYIVESSQCNSEDSLIPTTEQSLIKDKSQGCYTWEIG